MQNNFQHYENTSRLKHEKLSQYFDFSLFWFMKLRLWKFLFILRNHYFNKIHHFEIVSILTKFSSVWETDSFVDSLLFWDTKSWSGDTDLKLQTYYNKNNENLNNILRKFLVSLIKFIFVFFNNYLLFLPDWVINLRTFSIILRYENIALRKCLIILTYRIFVFHI